MTSFLLYLLLWIWDNRSFEAVSQSNQIKRQAELAYQDKEFERAAQLFYRVTYGSLFAEPAARLNLAHSYYQAEKPEEAQYHYQLLTGIADKTVASKANTQLALIAVSRQDTAQALDQLVRALRQDQENLTARYNYELLRKAYSGRTPPRSPQQQPPPPAQNQPEPPPPPQEEGQSPELAEQREQLLKELRQLRMSEEQARAILDAMKTNEMQYIYQLRRRQYRRQTDQTDEVEW
ncbi:hypothetical protein [Telluribacter sp.]|jgi:tetratricopeptide (TPR) repeat protein|uniref:hypothetical protein n=1 Tax=Telluribacter sp. TaxID=1978767 RepID=UPI002E15B79B|nr:hypothetical protein [Telluribacter sp.]